MNKPESARRTAQPSRPRALRAPAIFLMIGAALLTAACSGGSGATTVTVTAAPSPSETTSASPSPADSTSTSSAAAPTQGEQTYSTVVQFKDAFVSAGGSCPAWNQTDKVAAAAQSGDCSGSSVLSIYTSPERAQQAAQDLKKSFQDNGITGGTLLVGGNWILNSPDATTVQGQLGGMVVNY